MFSINNLGRYGSAQARLREGSGAELVEKSMQENSTGAPFPRIAYRLMLA